MKLNALYFSQNSLLNSYTFGHDSTHNFNSRKSLFNRSKTMIENKSIKTFLNFNHNFDYTPGMQKLNRGQYNYNTFISQNNSNNINLNLINLSNENTTTTVASQINNSLDKLVSNKSFKLPSLKSAYSNTESFTSLGLNNSILNNLNSTETIRSHYFDQFERDKDLSSLKGVKRLLSTPFSQMKMSSSPFSMKSVSSMNNLANLVKPSISYLNNQSSITKSLPN
jgi:hypothetical protein